ncbi:TRAP transporter small permease [Thalassobacter stenotrophicus]|uniref:TRAP transporter small permease protein n=2 Tax=Thalassobacter stenotrophicus TaxID=266809 RepID=A0A0P1F1U8_9RHOB|nr:TRAP transporter small permease [Thalassobacter stenotrophicus]CUH61590.1 2,3-diketo-L-gulonate TRAP transporter small permease protein YiaM [Thalassobacter stenotrophicus]SHJ35050.1 TRAP-type C4-dicarboxylate transport system, small permease component [Thalassobacter stenotrophicus DSM 16310]
MKHIFKRIAQAFQIAGQVVLAFMMITICYDAFMRYVFTAPTSWSLEINTFLIVFVAAMTAADVQRTDSHIRITFFVDMLGTSAQRFTRLVIAVIGMIFSAIMTWRGVIMAHQAWDFGERVSSSFGTPMVYPYALLPLGFGMLALQFLFNALDAVMGKAPSGDDHQDLQEI